MSPILGFQIFKLQSSCKQLQLTSTRELHGFKWIFNLRLCGPHFAGQLPWAASINKSIQIIQLARHLKVGSIHQRHSCCMCIIWCIHWRPFQVVYCAAVCCDVGVLTGNEAQQDQATVKYKAMAQRKPPPIHKCNARAGSGVYDQLSRFEMQLGNWFPASQLLIQNKIVGTRRVSILGVV